MVLAVWLNKARSHILRLVFLKKLEVDKGFWATAVMSVMAKWYSAVLMELLAITEYGGGEEGHLRTHVGFGDELATAPLGVADVQGLQIAAIMEEMTDVKGVAHVENREAEFKHTRCVGGPDLVGQDVKDVFGLLERRWRERDWGALGGKEAARTDFCRAMCGRTTSGCLQTMEVSWLCMEKEKHGEQAGENEKANRIDGGSVEWHDIDKSEPMKELV